MTDNVLEPLVTWFRTHGRRFPWRETSSPWRILVAEILLRQTRAHDALPVYEEIVQRWQEPASMARADMEAVHSIVAPIGLPVRVHHLLETATLITKEHAGQVPRSLETLLTLPGVGPYAGRAIRCLAFNEREAMVDGNVRRVLTRTLALPEMRDREIQSLAETVLPPMCVREHNLALLDVGAMFCRTHRVYCPECPLCICCALSMANTRP